MFDNVITVVGGGASSVSLIDALFEGLAKEHGYGALTIFMVEKRSHFGRGLAYSEDIPTNLLNTQAAFITPFSNKPGHFYQWLQDHRDYWEDDFPNVALRPDAYLPRPLFGLYLSHMVQALGNRAVELGCRLILVNDEANRISFAHDSRVVVSTKGNLSFASDHVVLSCGNGSSMEYQHLVNFKGFFPTPYPIKRIVRVIPPQSRVAIIGSRLSAIDAVLGLTARGHTGPITLHSRTGALPSVRGTQGRYTPKYLTPDRVKTHISRHGVVRLDDCITWILEEMAAAGEIVPTTQITNLISKCIQIPPLNYLRKEIEAACLPRPWQAVLYSTNSIIDLVWTAMPEEDKRRFWPYFSWWMAYRVSIPVINASKIATLLDSGQLKVIPGELYAEPVEDGFTISVLHSGETNRYNYDAMIVATGTPRNVHVLDNPLVQNMLEQGIAIGDDFGGIKVSSSTGGLLGSTGNVDERITVLNNCA
jgi:uncharacterized NAD(P)/FAD-binding protein YdhS